MIDRTTLAMPLDSASYKQPEYPIQGNAIRDTDLSRLTIELFRKILNSTYMNNLITAVWGFDYMVLNGRSERSLEKLEPKFIVLQGLLQKEMYCPFS